jgi:hypothetical protein
MSRWSFLLALLFAACAGGQETEAVRAALDSQRASLEVLGARPEAPRSLPRATAPAAAPVPGRLGEGPAPRLASQFLGASPDTLVAALGEPSLRRDEGGAAVWLYSSGGCQLDVVLYPGPQGPQVAHVQARAGGLAQRTESACLRDIASHAAQGGGSQDSRRPAPAPELGA